MRPTVLSRLLNVSGQTLRRWTSDYRRFLSAGATPAKGKPRQLSEHDIRVLSLVATLRNAGYEPDKIIQRLEKEEAQGWEGLPDLPSEWAVAGETMSVALAASKAYDVAQNTILQRELESARQQLQIAEQRVDQLQQELETLRVEKTSSDSRVHALELELSQAHGEVATLQARLQSYALAYGMGRDRPLPLVLVVAVTAVAAVLVVLVVFVVARLLL
jgi:DNA-binding transcriptional MerR regulator